LFIEFEFLDYLFILWVGLVFPNKSSLSHLAHLNNKKAIGIVSSFQVCPQSQHISLKSFDPGLHDLVEFFTMPLFDMEVVTQLLDIRIDSCFLLQLILESPSFR
jgi:hypothetical protein